MGHKQFSSNPLSVRDEYVFIKESCVESNKHVDSENN